ncbi:MAG: hypothetical protein U0X75_17115 [Acidobacteriota bacterium]
MTKSHILKITASCLALFGIALTVQARPEYLRQFAADPLSKAELRNKCSVCHVNPAGGGAQ